MTSCNSALQQYCKHQRCSTDGRSLLQPVPLGIKPFPVMISAGKGNIVCTRRGFYRHSAAQQKLDCRALNQRKTVLGCWQGPGDWQPSWTHPLGACASQAASSGIVDHLVTRQRLNPTGQGPAQGARNPGDTLSAWYSLHPSSSVGNRRPTRMIFAAGFGLGLGTIAGLSVGPYLFDSLSHPKHYSTTMDEAADRDPTVPTPEPEAKVSNEMRSLLPYTEPWTFDPDYERVYMINRALAILWPTITETVMTEVMKQVRPQLQTQVFQKFAFIEDIVLGTMSMREGSSWDQWIRDRDFKVGGIPPRVGGIKALNTVEDEIILEVPLVWGSDCKFDVGVFLRLGPVRLYVPLEVANLQFKIETRITVKPLVETIPCVGGVTITLLKAPFIDLNLRIIKRVDLMAIPGIKEGVHMALTYVLNGMLIYPNTMSFPIMPNYGMLPPPKGALGIKLLRAEGLTQGSSTYVRLEVREGRPVFSKHVKGHKNPEWNQEFNLIVDDFVNQTLDVVVYDDESFGWNAEPIGAGVLTFANVVKKSQVHEVALTRHKCTTGEHLVHNTHLQSQRRTPTDRSTGGMRTSQPGGMLPAGQLLATSPVATGTSGSAAMPGFQTTVGSPAMPHSATLPASLRGTVTPTSPMVLSPTTTPMHSPPVTSPAQAPTTPPLPGSNVAVRHPMSSPTMPTTASAPNQAPPAMTKQPLPYSSTTPHVGSAATAGTSMPHMAGAPTAGSTMPHLSSMATAGPISQKTTVVAQGPTPASAAAAAAAVTGAVQPTAIGGSQDSAAQGLQTSPVIQGAGVSNGGAGATGPATPNRDDVIRRAQKAVGQAQQEAEANTADDEVVELKDFIKNPMREHFLAINLVKPETEDGFVKSREEEDTAAIDKEPAEGDGRHSRSSKSKSLFRKLTSRSKKFASSLSLRQHSDLEPRGTLFLKVTFLPFLQHQYDDEEEEAAGNTKKDKAPLVPGGRMVPGNITDTTKGVLTVHLIRCINLKGQDPDTYVRFIVTDDESEQDQEQKSTTIHNQESPRWGARFDFVMVRAASHLYVTVFRKPSPAASLVKSVNVFSKKPRDEKDKIIGRLSLPVKDVARNGRLKDIWTLEDVEHGQIELGLNWQTVDVTDDM